MMSTTKKLSPVFGRRHDLDWLRIIAFAILIVYHIGLFFSSLDYHLKSSYASSAPDLVLNLVNPWRLSLLFFISGVSIRFLIDKLGRFPFAIDRVTRFLPPILFGVVALVMPQAYFELRQQGLIEPGIFAFWGDYLTSWRMFHLTVPTWNHLWYVVYLLIYCLILVPIIPVLNAIEQGAVGVFVRRLLSSRFGVAVLAVFPVVPFMVYAAYLDPIFPVTYDVSSDWANHAHRFTMLLIGYFAAKSPLFWRLVERMYPSAIWLSVSLGIALLLMDVLGVEAEEALDRRLGEQLYAWTVILSALGLAQEFLQRDSAARRYLTEAIFPYYILHQTILLSAGYYLTALSLGAWTEFFLIVLVTVAGCVLGFEGVRRVMWLRPLMGLKVESNLDRGKRPSHSRGVDKRQVDQY